MDTKPSHTTNADFLAAVADINRSLKPEWLRLMLLKVGAIDEH